MSEINKIIKTILKNRGYTSDESIQEYFAKKPKLTYDPFLMKGMSEACDLIIKNIKAEKRICIFGDYDADGITSVVVMQTVLSKLTNNLTYYIPSRFDEGYGLNMKAIKKIAMDGVDLIITVDCGCTAVEEVALAKNLGMEIIVTDHHSITDRAADCIILNPKQEDDNYPYSFLCGCGVAFKLTQALLRRLGLDRSILLDVLDLVGIATIGDIVPLENENRTLVKYAIACMKNPKRLGLKALMNAGDINASTLNSYNIAFGIVPRINSSGRIDSASLGVELLACVDEEIAINLANKINRLNQERKSIQENIFKKAVEEIDACSSLENFIVYYAGKANEGITGIVAGNLREKYDRPVIVLTDMDDMNLVKGTGRSIEKIHLYNLLNKFQNCFYKFGGHAGACGFTIYREKIDFLIEGLNSELEKMLKKDPDLFVCEIKPDVVINSSEISLDLIEQINEMEPFGHCNEKPLFLVQNIHVHRVFSMGNMNQYKKLICSNGSGKNFDCVIFDKDLASVNISEGMIISAVGELSINQWNNNSIMQIIVKKII